jgi:tRNA(Ile)-lysidine synthase
LTAAAVEKRVRAGGLLAEGRRVLVLLSGGRDSMCLLDLATRISGQVRALHVNYGLREDAGADEALCREVCAQLGVPLTVRHAPREQGGAPRNLQAWARERRYGLAVEHADGDDVATGHTADDQVETVLYRLASSPGRRALLGMPGRREHLIRPLLEVTRAQTTAYCVERGVAYVDDPTNESGRFARNRVRARLIAALRDIHPAADANILRTLEILRDEAAVLDEVLDEVRTDDVERLRELPAALQRLLLGPRAAEILALESGALDLGGGERAVIEHGRVRTTREPPPESPAPAELPVPGSARFGAGRVTAEPVAGGTRVSDGVLDADALATEALGRRLEVRAWRPGDRMRPLGLGGSRSLQDLFTDRKVPRERRRVLPVVVSGDEIAWVPGVATGERFKVTGATRARVRLAWHP